MSKRHDFSIFYKTKEVKKESPENNTKMLRDQFFCERAWLLRML